MELDAKYEENLLNHGYTTGHRGSGLGLSMIKTLADAHYWETNLAIGEDSFTITIDGLSGSTPIDREIYEKWVQPR